MTDAANTAEPAGGPPTDPVVPENGPPTEAELRTLLRDHMGEVVRLTKLLPAPAAAEIDFGVEVPRPTGRMRSARHSDKVNRAIKSLAAADAELGFANFVEQTIRHFAERLAIAI